MIEGDQATLEFLGNFILEHARNPKDCGIQMYPGGPGGLGFNPKSEMGIYVHRLPCWNEMAKAEAKRRQLRRVVAEKAHRRGKETPQ
jgi:hypothetical protein